MPTECEDRTDWNEGYEALVISEECPPPPPGTDESEEVIIDIDIEYSEGWNLVSVPLNMINASASVYDLFPTHVSGTLYSFSGQYHGPETFMLPGNGYWLVFDDDGTQTITGGAINELTISLNENWNLISGVSFKTNVYDIIDPEGIITPGTVYEFTDLYYGTTALYPGKGYWIHAHAAGEITIYYPGDPYIGPWYDSVEH